MSIPDGNELQSSHLLNDVNDLSGIRAAIRDLVRPYGRESVIDTMLVADELAVIALGNGQLPGEVHAVISPFAAAEPQLRVEVRTGRGALPPGTAPSRESWKVLNSCTLAWGISRDGERTTFWANVRLRSEDPDEQAAEIHVLRPRRPQS
ncbi:hypothetical protein [Amycolatopsis magusensis]|uniref:Serine/threonine-protein kinase RsbW n=1 Tax=Amycolatopsis magusensis TaxID=882444 RepID=A0ABS4Q247_9PSEU|nr:hypothetical protein [Amycolatopsis magusensis]MBP2185757.1 hypothetical protein [Amycolatopsis magusensis]MDI5979671.1 hypothetical protein [Amycolatopsis magusensis]